ncbi:MAG: hypothetical protein WC505_06795 [Patescibacteria group bacterium]
MILYPKNYVEKPSTEKPAQDSKPAILLIKALADKDAVTYEEAVKAVMVAEKQAGRYWTNDEVCEMVKAVDNEWHGDGKPAAVEMLVEDKGKVK